MKNTMTNTNDLADLWGVEYSKRGIPSSFRGDPSGSVVSFCDFLAANGVTNGTALDLGCGMGRNSLYLVSKGFRVHSIDFVSENIECLRQAAQELDIHLELHCHCQSVTDPWPLASSSIDVAIDTFCYKHQVHREKRATYRTELFRTLKGGALYLLTLAGIDDGYYGPLLLSSPDCKERIIVDPANRIPSVLFSKADVEAEFSAEMDIAFYEHKKKEGRMHGRSFMRSTHVFVFRKR